MYAYIYSTWTVFPSPMASAKIPTLTEPSPPMVS